MLVRVVDFLHEAVGSDGGLPEAGELDEGLPEAGESD